MRRTSKRRNIMVNAEMDTNVKDAEMSTKNCCVCCHSLPSDVLLELSTVVERDGNLSPCTVAAVIETFATIKVKEKDQSICNDCWREVQAAYLLQQKLQKSKHLVFGAGEIEKDTNVAMGENSDANATEHADCDDLFIECSSQRLQNGEDFEFEYLEEYLESTKCVDHTYDSMIDVQEEEQEEEVNHSTAMSAEMHTSVTIEESLSNVQLPVHPNIIRQFEMPRAIFVQRNELYEQYRLLEVRGVRCCGCSFVAENRKELLQHSETVHAVDITDSGSYCPICFFKFATDKKLDRHMEECKSTTMFVCLQCNCFFNLREKLYNHLLKCGEDNGEESLEETEDEDIDEADCMDTIEGSFELQEEMADSSTDASFTKTYLDKMLQYRSRFDDMISSDTFSCALGELDLNVQQYQVATQYSFDSFKYIRLRGERCCGCSFTCYNREQLMQHAKANHAREVSEANEYACLLCGSLFPEELELVKHLCFFASKELLFCTICNESFLNKESLRYHQEHNERHREQQLDKFQQAGIEVVLSQNCVELDLPGVNAKLEQLEAGKIKMRSRPIRYIPMPEDGLIKNKIEHKNYSILTVCGERCCGCGKFFATMQQLRQHSRQEHSLPLGSGWISENQQCEICFRTFDFERGLVMHRAMRRCNKSILYLCKLCGLLFSKRFCLARHMQTAPNHLSQLILEANSNKTKNLENEPADPQQVEQVPDPAESDLRVTEALQLHKSIQDEGLKKPGHFVGYQCCFIKCQHKFTHEQELLRHAQEEHSGKRRQNEIERNSDENVCPCCCKPFRDPAKLAWHRFQRFVPRQFDCKHCDRTFEKWQKLNVHVETEHRDSAPKFVCTVCNKSFLLNSRLKSHMKLHSSEREFACDVCGDRFNSNGLLKRHRRSVHSTELLFECKVCSKRFAVIEKLQIHQRVHTGEKPFPCTYCHRSFGHHTDRKRHEMSAHTGERPYKCPYCSAAYVRNRELNLHLQKHNDMIEQQLIVHE